MVCCCAQSPRVRMLTSISSWPELNTGSSNSGSFGGFGTFAMAPTVNGGTEENAPSARPLRRMSARPPTHKAHYQGGSGHTNQQHVRRGRRLVRPERDRFMTPIAEVRRSHLSRVRPSGGALLVRSPVPEGSTWSQSRTGAGVARILAGRVFKQDMCAVVAERRLPWRRIRAASGSRRRSR